MKFIVPITMIFCGCASFPRSQGISPSDAGDRTAIILGCEGAMLRGYEVCRFNEGQVFGEATITVMVPWASDTIGATVKFRSQFKAISLMADSAIVTIRYKDLFNGERMTKEMDGPIQVIITSIDATGKRVSLLGYLIIVVLKSGYNPVPWSKDTRCELSYDTSGRSHVECDR